MKTPTHTDTTRAISHIAPATRSARSRAILFLAAAACALAPAAANATLSWTPVTPPTDIDGETTVAVSGATNPFSTPITGASTGVLTVQGTTTADTLTLSGTLAGFAGNIAVANSTLKLSAVNSGYAGSISVTGGVLSVTDVTYLGTGVKTLNNATLQFITSAGDKTSNQSLTLTGNNIIEVTRSAAQSATNVLLYGTLTGTGGSLTKTGDGNLSLYSENDYTGSITVDVGGLYLQHAKAIAKATELILNGDAQLVLGTNTQVKQITTSTSAVVLSLGAYSLSVTGDGESTIKRPITGTGKLIKSGSGLLEPVRNSTYSGGTEVLGGILRYNNDDKLGANTATIDKNILNGGTLLLYGATTYTRPWTLGTAGGTIQIPVDITATQSGNLTGTGGSLTKNGAGTLILSGTNNYTGGTTIAEGVLSINANARLGSNDDEGANKLSGGTLLFNTAGTYTRGWTLTTGTTSTLSNAGAVEQSGKLTGSGNLIKTGGGVLKLSGVNDYTGSTTISGGTVSIATNGNLGKDNYTPAQNILNTGTTLLLTPSGDLTFERGWTLNGSVTISVTSGHAVQTGVLVGEDANLIKTGDRYLSLSAENAYTGTTTVNAGRLYLRHTLAIAASSGVTLAGTAQLHLGGTDSAIQLLNSTSATATVDLRGYTLSITGAGASSYSGTFEGNGEAEGTDGSIIKSGNGTLTLNTNSDTTYSGGITILGGTVSINSDAKLGSNAVIGKNILNGGTLKLTAAGPFNRHWTLGINGGAINTDTTATQHGVLTGEGRFTKTGTGTLTLNNGNNYTGGTTISGGTLSITDDGNLGTNKDAKDNILNGGTLQLVFSDPKDFERGWTLIGDNTIDVPTTSSTAQLLVALEGGGNLTKTGVGYLALLDKNTYTGTTTVSKGRLYLGHPLAIAASSELILSNDAQLILGTSSQVKKITTSHDDMVIALGANTLSVTGDGESSIQRAITGTSASNIIKSGSGTLSLTRISTGYDGGLEVLGGILRYNEDDKAGNNAAAGKNILNGGTLQLYGAVTYERPWTLGTAGGTIDTSVAITQKGLLTGTGGLTKTGTGTLTISTANDYSGGTTISGGTLSITDDGNLGTNKDAKDNILNGGTLQLVFSNPKNFERGWTLIGNNTIDVPTTSSTAQLLVALEGGGNLTKTGVGYLALLDKNTYTGTTTVSAGRLYLGHPLAIAASSELILNGATAQLILGTSSQVKRITTSHDDMVIALGANTLSVTGDGDSLIQRAITGTSDSSIIKSGSGTLWLIRSSDLTYFGGLEVLDGILRYNNDAKAGANAAVEKNILNGGTLQLYEAGTFARAWTLGTAGGTIQIPENVSVTQSGLLTGEGGSFTKNGAGTLTLTTANTYTGATTVEAGTLILTGVGAISTTGALTVADGATFNMSGITAVGATVSALYGSDNAAIVLGNRTLTVSGKIDFTGQITSSGAAGKIVGSENRNITLTGDSVLAAAIDVTASKLSVNGTLKGVGGVGEKVAIEVHTDGLLGGTGAITGDIIVFSKGTLSPGNSPGELTVDGNVTLQDGATLLVEISNTNGLKYDTVTVTEEGVFTFWEDSIIDVNVSLFHGTDFVDVPIVTSETEIAFNGDGLGIVTLNQPEGWELTLSLGEGGKSLLLTGHNNVPEPGTYALFGAIGAVGLALIHRRKKQRK